MSKDTIYRQDAIDEISEYGDSDIVYMSVGELRRRLEDLPSAQPEKDILSWLLAYHTKSFELQGRYMPHEVIGWLVHDFANAYMAERRTNDER